MRSNSYAAFLISAAPEGLKSFTQLPFPNLSAALWAYLSVFLDLKAAIPDTFDKKSEHQNVRAKDVSKPTTNGNKFQTALPRDLV